MILVTGCLGYIGSHTVLQLLGEGFEVVGVDNLSNSSIEVLGRIEKLSGKKIKFYQYDLCDKDKTFEIFAENNISAVIHFAGLKSPGESVAQPLEYYRVNLTSTMNVISAMKEYGVKKIVFSSSASIYGDAKTVPVTEDTPFAPLSPYARTKAMIENILRDCSKTSFIDVVSLRYFNPVGAHESGEIGENPNGIPNNLMPYITQVATGKLPCLSIFGNDYDTMDGTGIRDYIHIEDLAGAHLKALLYLKENSGYEAFNVGTGKGVSVLELVTAFEKVNGLKLNYKYAPRREGDIVTSFADVAKANKVLKFYAYKSVEDMCRDAYRWESKNQK